MSHEYDGCMGRLTVAPVLWEAAEEVVAPPDVCVWDDWEVAWAAVEDPEGTWDEVDCCVARVEVDIAAAEVEVGAPVVDAADELPLPAAVEGLGVASSPQALAAAPTWVP